MDKLAQRYNAQEMIMANSQAEAARMQNLQEQVEAYEAVLQEMRKLNYKNTELTEKMYSLVDESIEKVRTLQLEAVEGNASAEMVTREMSDAVTAALNEALNNMDATVAKTLSESLAVSLARPTEELKQSTELVGSTAQGIKDAMMKLELSAEALAASSFEIQNTAAVVQTSTEGFRDSLSGMQERISGIYAGMGSVQESIGGVYAGMSSMQESMSGIYSTMGGMQESMGGIQSGISGINNVQESMQGIQIGMSGLQESMQSVQTGMYGLQENVQQGVQVGINGVQEKMQGIQSGVESLQESMQGIQTGMTGISGLQETMQGVQTDIREGIGDLYTTINNMQASIASLVETSAQPNDAHDAVSEEIRGSLSEISSAVSEVSTGVRNLKSSTDDTRTSLKTAFESGIYGLKQDNREIVEFMQRMNNNLMAKKEDPEKEQKEAEAKEKEAENQRILEEHFKTLEDFMHKESVKVYRNVQAVVNEKIDRQALGNEDRNNQMIVRVKGVKTAAVVAIVLSAINIAITVLNILGII
ncbi:MAG: hypothetical protein K2K20_10380 [Lachnospiraceae bacterium]|nr:hypothetical protein [Lachnospiraceae bacterium]